MKKINIKFVYGLILVIGLVVLNYSFKSSESSKKYLTMMVYKAGMKLNSKIIIISENGQKEEIPLESNARDTEVLINNAVVVNATMNKIGSKGYVLKSTVQEFLQDGFLNTQYIFEKD